MKNQCSNLKPRFTKSGKPRSGYEKIHCLAIVLCLLAFLLAPRVEATWSNDPAINMAIVSSAGSQVVPHIVAAPDGGCYVSWYDGNAGYDVRLQRLDVSGTPLWGDTGVLVADTSFSSVTDYGIACDPEGRVLLSFIGNTLQGEQVIANLISPDGILLWGSGIQLSSGTAFVAAPVSAIFSSGGYAVAWVSDASSIVQKLDTAGTVLWGDGIVISDPGAGNLLVSDMKGAEDGTIILSFVQYIQFSGAKHLYAHKLDGDAVPLWNPNPIPVFDSGSLQMGNFPDFTTDGAGGAVLSWYDVSGNLQCRVQHLLADGSEAFPHNGIIVSTNSSRQRTNPASFINPTTSDTFVFWVETNMNQSLWGVYGQKISSDGQRQWTDNGKEISPVSSLNHQQLCVLPLQDGAVVSFMQETGILTSRLLASRVDATGQFVWTPNIIELSTANSAKGSHTACNASSGSMVHVWEDNRMSSIDIYGQNINPDGSLGNIMTPTPTSTPACLHHGDVNFSGSVTAGDAQLAFAIALGVTIPTFDEECAADCNANGSVTAGDAQDIFGVALGMATCFDPL